MAEFLTGLFVTIVVGVLVFVAVLGFRAVVDSGPKCPPGYTLYVTQGWQSVEACFKDGSGVVPH